MVFIKKTNFLAYFRGALFVIIIASCKHFIKKDVYVSKEFGSKT